MKKQILIIILLLLNSLIVFIPTGITTDEHSIPRVDPSGITDVGNTTANATMTITNGFNCSYGVWYGTTFPVDEDNADGNISNTGLEKNQTDGLLTSSITGLTAGQLYYTTAWVSNPSGFYNSSHYNYSFANYSYHINGSGWIYLTFPSSIFTNNQSVDDARDDDDRVVIETFLNISNILDDVEWIFRVSDFKNWNKGAGGNTLTNLTWDEEYYFKFFNATNISFLFDKTEETEYSYLITFPKELFDYNSSLNVNNTPENFCQQGGIWDDIDIIFGYDPLQSWVKGRPFNTLTEITYNRLHAFFMLNYTANLDFIYDKANSNSTFLTRPNPPTNLTLDFNTTNANLTWDKNAAANRTIITVKVGSSPTSPTDGTVIYNDTGETYVDSYVDYSNRFYTAWSYINWSYNPTLWQTSSSSASANTTYIVNPPYDGSSVYVFPYVNLTWSSGDNSDQEIVVQNNDSYATSPTDGWVRQNSTNTWFVGDSTVFAYFTVWSYNSTNSLFSIVGLDIPWGALITNVYDEETNESLEFDIEVSNQDGSQNYEKRNNTNPHYLDISQLPIGDDIKITVRAASNYSSKSESSTWGINENQTITYIVLSQVPDSKSTTNVTCINTSDDAHSYPPFTLDGDIVTILPDNADTFTLIYVNYTHEEYSSRLYYRDISESVFDTLNAYLPPTEDKQLCLLEVIDEASNTVSDAHIEVKRSVNGTYVVISRLLTDANGQADINLISDRNYIFVINKDGYLTENASWTPSTEIFTHTFKLLWENIPFEPDTFGDIIDIYGTLFVNNTMRVTFYDLNDEMIDSHFLIYEDYNGTLTYMGEYNGTTSNDITFWINVSNATRLHTIVLFMNHTTLGEIYDYSIPVFPVHIDRVSGTWLENLIVSVVGEWAYGYVITLLWVFPCVLLIAGLAAIKHPGTGILGAGIYSFWITWNITLPNEARILTFASIALVVGIITIFLVKGTKVIK